MPIRGIKMKMNNKMSSQANMSEANGTARMLQEQIHKAERPSSIVRY